MSQSNSESSSGMAQPRNKSLYDVLANPDSGWSLHVMIVVNGARAVVSAFNGTDSASGREVLVTRAYVDKYKRACHGGDLRKLVDMFYELDRALDSIIRLVPRSTGYIATSEQIAYGSRVV